jgi:hypothetical protein
MKSTATFKCLHCNEIHDYEPRSRGRQRYCPAPDCRRASKAESQRRWLSRPENESYFRGAAHAERVRQWRKEHPGYWRKKISAPGGTLQEISEKISERSPVPSLAQVVDKEVMDNPKPPAPPSGPPAALQEISLLQFVLQPALLVGLIAVMTGTVLQEDIARSAQWLLDRGEDILRMVPRSPPISPHENQTHSVPGTPAAGAAPVQLDRSASGP